MMRRSILSLAIVAAACAPPLTPVFAQTARDSATVKAVKPVVDSALAHDRMICKTSAKRAYLCADTTKLKSASAYLAATIVGPAPTPVPTPVPSPTPTPTPVPSPTPTPGDPELPRATVNTTYPTLNGTVRNVPAGGDVNAALAAAQPGDQIVLVPGVSYTGNLVQPQNNGCASGAGYVVVRSGGADSDYPPAGARITPAYAPKLAKIVTPNVAPAIFVHGGACKVWFSRVEITATPQSSTVGYNYGLVRVGEGEGTIDWQPADIVFDRVYVHGNPVQVQHAFILNGRSNAIVDSYCADIYDAGVESHCVASWAGAGPFTLSGNYFDAAGANIMFGGADPTIAGLSPSDITVTRNYLTKQLAYKGKGYAVKNLLELKHAKRVRIDGNVIENSWADAQIGWAVIMQSATDRPDLAPQTETRDVTMRYNWIRNANGGIDLTSNGYNGSGIPASHLLFADNLLTNIGGEGTSTGVQLLNALSFVTVRHNTIVRNTTAYGMPFSLDGTGASSITLANNILASAAPYSAVFKTGGATGSAALTQFAGSSWSTGGNVVVGDVIAQSAEMPGSLFAPDTASLRFAPDFSLLATSSFKSKATDGRDPGADVAGVLAATAGVVQGVPMAARPASTTRIPIRKPIQQ